MKPYYEDDLVQLHHGDCRDVLATLPDASVDAVVTDPPYELGFMGKGWDASGIAYDVGMWRECLRVLKPGGHMLAFGGSRTWHRLAVAIEDAGFEMRDCITWHFGSGFPKSLDVSKAIDRARDDRGDILRVTGAIRELRDAANLTNRDLDDLFNFAGMAGHWTSVASQPAVPTVEQWSTLRDVLNPPAWLDAEVWRLNGRKGSPGEAWGRREVIGSASVPIGHAFAGSTYGGDSSNKVTDITAPATPDAARWEGFGTALKPATEFVTLARKPFPGTVASNVLTWGTGALNIDGCRVGTGDVIHPRDRSDIRGGSFVGATQRNPDAGAYEQNPSGRWPANVILDEFAAAELDRQSGECPSAGECTNSLTKPEGTKQIFGSVIGSNTRSNAYAGETGGASRFFYVAKAPKSERPKVNGIAHATVKPLTLIRYLVRLVTPPGGTVLEPFAGSGTTAEACVLEHMRCIAIEREDTYLPLIVQRLTKPLTVGFDLEGVGA